MVSAERRLVGKETVEVAPGVFAYLQLDGGWCLNNAGVITGDGRAIVVDTAATAARASALRETVGRLAGRAPLALVNTHHHGDHCFGNDFFGPDVPVIAHAETRAELAAGGLGLCAMWPEVDWGDIRLRLPDLTFSDELTLYSGHREVRLMYVGPAHTTNDTIVLLPAEGVLFAGDIVSNGVTPFVLMGSVAGSISAIERLKRLPVTTVVPGHGMVGGVELFDETLAYLKWIQCLAADGAAAGLTPLETARLADLGEWAELVDPERLVGNLTRAYAELSGEPLGAPLDVMAAFQHMTEFNGKLPTCLA